MGLGTSATWNKSIHKSTNRNERNHRTPSTALVKTAVLYSAQKCSFKDEPLMAVLREILPIGTASTMNPTLRLENSPLAFSNTISVPAQLLNSFLEACYKLDHLICGSAQTSKDEISIWQALEPFVYLTSPVILERWENALALLCQQYLDGTFTPSKFEEKLATILPGVESLEEARKRLVQGLDAELKSCGVDIDIPEEFWEAVEGRCTIIDDAFLALERILDSQV